jgi:hypothetical protein
MLTHLAPYHVGVLTSTPSPAYNVGPAPAEDQIWKDICKCVNTHGRIQLLKNDCFSSRTVHLREEVRVLEICRWATTDETIR